MLVRQAADTAVDKTQKECGGGPGQRPGLAPALGSARETTQSTRQRAYVRILSVWLVSQSTSPSNIPSRAQSGRRDATAVGATGSPAIELSYCWYCRKHELILR